MKPQMIVFGEDWGGLPSSTQHIIKQLSGQYTVTWVNSLGLRTPKATWHDVKRVFNKAGRLFQQALGQQTADQQANKSVEVNSSFEVVEPQYLPFLGSRIVRKINRGLLYRLLKRHVNPVAKGPRPVIWISLPTAVDALYYLPEPSLSDFVVIYYCCDDFSALNGVDHQAVSKLENELAQQADVIVATSAGLVDKFPFYKTHLVPHGVDHQLFYQSSGRAEDLPRGRAIAGFYGSIAGWVDLELLREVAMLMPDWDFVFIGAIKVDISSLNALVNVFFLGEKPHEALPSYSQHWQVSLLPFVLNEQIIASNPLKLREYMAAGKPIVSVDFPQARFYSRYIRLATGAQAFAKAINDAHQELPQSWALRQQAVADESWQSVAEQIDDLVRAV